MTTMKKRKEKNIAKQKEELNNEIIV